MLQKEKKRGKKRVGRKSLLFLLLFKKIIINPLHTGVHLEGFRLANLTSDVGEAGRPRAGQASPHLRAPLREVGMWDLLSRAAAASFSHKQLKLKMERINGQLQAPACAWMCRAEGCGDCKPAGLMGPFPSV